jgi:hypothetical protein
VNGSHLRAFLWLRWRLRVNQIKRGGIVNAVILGTLAVLAVLLAAVLFVGFFLLGLLALKDVPPSVLLYVWDGLVVVFLFAWSVGVLAELQRSESLSLDKFLHLPVSLTGAFLINYLSSLPSVSLLLFLPATVGLSLGLIFSRGPAFLWLLPLLAAFLLMVTALTYQFQGWLASLMANKRRRSTIIVLATTLLILLSQLPNLVNILRPWNKVQPNEVTAQVNNEQAQLDRAFAAGKITPEEYMRRQQEIADQRQARNKEENRESLQKAEGMARLVNAVLPPGWLPLGAMASAEGDFLLPLLGMCGMTLIGSSSLWRSYRTTVRLYTGHFTSGRTKAVPASVPAKTETHVSPFLERQVPWLSEHAAAIALSGFRSLTRAPEAKMMLLTPVILVLIFGAMFLAQRVELPPSARPMLAFGAMSMILFSMIQFVGNQFGFDRSGFRVFVLSPAGRRDILLGKNLAVAPLALGLGIVAAILLQIFYPMRLAFFLAVPPQFLSMYLLFCLLANCLSIISPMPISPGSLRPVNPKGLTILLHAAFVFLLPLALLPTLIPLGFALMLEELGLAPAGPIHLTLSLLVCVAVVCLYRYLLTWQGKFLQAREQKILEIVTTKAE